MRRKIQDTIDECFAKLGWGWYGRLTRNLEPGAGCPVYLSFYQHGGDYYPFARRIGRAFERAGWRIADFRMLPGIAEGYLKICGYDSQKPFSVDVVVNAFEKAKVPFERAGKFRPGPYILEIIIGEKRCGKRTDFRHFLLAYSNIPETT